MTGALGSRRLAAVVLGVLALLGLAWLLDRYAAPGTGGPPLSVHSTQKDGARALYLWLAELGYESKALEYRPFSIEPSSRVLMVLAPDTSLGNDHATQIVSWVEGGGTLVVVSDSSNALTRKLGVEVKERNLPVARVVPLQPVFGSPPVRDVEATSVSSLRFTRAEWVPILGSVGGAEVVGAAAQLGAGRAHVLATTGPLRNDGLGKADNWAVMRYFLSGIPAGSVVLFDEYHHGLTEHGTLGRRLLGEPWGWSILLSGTFLFAYVVLSGRRFGPPLPVASGVARRSRSEYVATMSALLHHGKHRAWLSREYAGQVKRSLARRYRVRADLPAAAFVSELVRIRPDAEELALLIRRLEDAPPGDDATLVSLIRDVETAKRQMERDAKEGKDGKDWKEGSR